MTDTLAEVQTLGVGSRVKHPGFGDGVVIAVKKIAYEVVFILHGMQPVSRSYSDWKIIEATEAPAEISFTEAEKALTKILQHYNGVQERIEIGERWEGGTMILQPKDTNLKSKEVPLDVFFNKIIMVRDRLRVMEQRINSSKSMTGEEKLNLHQYLTKIYGSLTTFNVLFSDKKDYFVGERK